MTNIYFSKVKCGVRPYYHNEGVPGLEVFSEEQFAGIEVRFVHLFCMNEHQIKRYVNKLILAL